jgi:hypothetical protein
MASANGIARLVNVEFLVVLDRVAPAFEPRRCSERAELRGALAVPVVVST